VPLTHGTFTTNNRKEVKDYEDHQTVQEQKGSLLQMLEDSSIAVLGQWRTCAFMQRLCEPSYRGVFMKLSEAVICVNMVNCQICGGKGKYKEGRTKQWVACPRCNGDKNYQEECAELLHTSAKRCPSCTGSSLLLLSKLRTHYESVIKESAGKPGKAIENV